MKACLFSKGHIFLLFLLFIAFLFGVFCCCQKSGLFVDEVITIGQANSDKGGWIREVNEEFTDGDMTGHVLSGKEIFEYLTVDESERFDLYSTYRNLSTDVHPPLFHVLLKVFYSFKISSLSYWPGLILNIILFMIGNFLMYKICYDIFDDGIIASITMLLYALSPSTLSSLIFIRMYMLLSVMTMLLIYEVIRLFSKKNKMIYPIISLTILLGMLTQYFFVFPAFFICLSVLVILIVRKEIKSAEDFKIQHANGAFGFVAGR